MAIYLHRDGQSWRVVAWLGGRQCERRVFGGRDEAERVEAELKSSTDFRSKRRGEGCIYFIRCGENGPIKIGFTAKPVAARLEELQTAHHEALCVMGDVPGTVATERILHARFAHLRIRGEWFSPGSDLLADIAAWTAK